MSTLLIILLVIFCVTGLPSLGVWNHGWGYGPSGIGGLLLLVLIVLLVTGRI